MRNLIRFVLAATFTLVLAGNGLAQTASSVLPPARPLKLQIVLSKYEGERKISMPFTLSGMSGKTGSLRIGEEIPTTVTPVEGRPPFIFNQVGTQIDYVATPAEDGRIRLQLTITTRSPLPGGQFANFISSNTMTLKDGETTQYSGSDSTGKTMNVDVTLTVAASSR